MKKLGIKIFFGIAFCVIAVASALSFGLMYLWNWLATDLFHLSAINFWQALGLMAMFRILFGSFKFGKGRWGHGCAQCGHQGHEHGGGWFKEKMKKKFERKLEHMTPEEREKFRKTFLWSCCPGDGKDQASPGAAEPKQEGI